MSYRFKCATDLNIHISECIKENFICYLLIPLIVPERNEVIYKYIYVCIYIKCERAENNQHGNLFFSVLSH